MRKKASAKGSTKRGKKAAKIADLRVRSVRGGEAAAVKGGFMKIEGFQPLDPK